MPAASATPTKRSTLNLRIKPADRGLLDRAVKASGKDCTAFVLDAMRAAAEDTLLERTVILADPDAYTAFLAKLDAPVKVNARLRETMRTPAPWD
jgi:uncharacterized protein (DUF1778 family)